MDIVDWGSTMQTGHNPNTANRNISEPPATDPTKQDDIREEISSARIGGVVVAIIFIVWFVSNFGS